MDCATAEQHGPHPPADTWWPSEQPSAAAQPAPLRWGTGPQAQQTDPRASAGRWAQDGLRRSGQPIPCQLLDDGHADDIHWPNETEVKVRRGSLAPDAQRKHVAPSGSLRTKPAYRAGWGETQPEPTVPEMKPVQSCYCLSQLGFLSQVTPSIWTGCP